MKTTTKRWLKMLWAAVITGASTSGLSALGVTGANLVGVKIPPLDLKQLGVMCLAGGVIGLLAYLKQSPVPPDEDPAGNAGKLLSWLAITGLLTGTAGCRALAPDGVYAGDQVLYQAELNITTSYDVLHTYVTWEKENRLALTRWPEIRRSADLMRRDAKQWFATAHALRDAYAARPSDENRAALQTALNVLRAALSEAAGYMARAAAGPAD